MFYTCLFSCCNSRASFLHPETPNSSITFLAHISVAPPAPVLYKNQQGMKRWTSRVPNHMLRSGCSTGTTNCLKVAGQTSRVRFCRLLVAAMWYVISSQWTGTLVIHRLPTRITMTIAQAKHHLCLHSMKRNRTRYELQNPTNTEKRTEIETQ